MFCAPAAATVLQATARRLARTSLGTNHRLQVAALGVLLVLQAQQNAKETDTWTKCRRQASISCVTADAEQWERCIPLMQSAMTELIVVHKKETEEVLGRLDPGAPEA